MFRYVHSYIIFVESRLVAAFILITHLLVLVLVLVLVLMSSSPTSSSSSQTGKLRLVSILQNIRRRTNIDRLVAIPYQIPVVLEYSAEAVLEYGVLEYR
jgi:hypothetical protein